MSQNATSEDFSRLVDPFRRELLAHCYRMLGSAHDAEDLVQETYLRAWRSYGQFEGRSSLRTWLYRIATRSCLTALESRGRRPLPYGPDNPGDMPQWPAFVTGDVIRPEHLPGRPPIQPNDPAGIVTSQETMRLALSAALQHLSPGQCAVVILREVLKCRAAEVAELLDTTPPAVNSSLQRARAQLAKMVPAEADILEPTDPDERRLLDSYVAAIGAGDITAVAELRAEHPSILKARTAFVTPRAA